MIVISSASCESNLGTGPGASLRVGVRAGMSFSLKAAALEAEEKQNALASTSVWQKKKPDSATDKARRTRNEGRVRALKQMRQERQQRREQPGQATLTIQEST